MYVGVAIKKVNIILYAFTNVWFVWEVENSNTLQPLQPYLGVRQIVQSVTSHLEFDYIS